jgi:hypothetical protein
LKITSEGITFDTADLFRLSDGAVLMPRRFVKRIESAEPQEGLAELEIEVDSWGRPRCVALRVTAKSEGAVTGDMLRRLPVARHVERAALQAASVVEVQKDLRGGITQIGPVSNREQAAEVLESAARRVPRRGSPVSDEHLKQVATLYRKALRMQGPKKAPTEAVAMQMHVSRSTAGRWVRKARDAGFLGPGHRGRAGG